VSTYNLSSYSPDLEAIAKCHCGDSQCLRKSKDFDIMDELYPVSCPFCTIAEAYPPAESKNLDPQSLIRQSVPEEVDIDKLSPPCFLIVSATDVLAFLDIQPMTPGHILVISRSHYPRLAEMPEHHSQELGTASCRRDATMSFSPAAGFWLPVITKAVISTIDCTDYNIVQNNGMP